MKFVTSIILFSILVILSTNCTLLKKRHSVGYKVEWHKHYKKSNALIEKNKQLDKTTNSETYQFETDNVVPTPLIKDNLSKEELIIEYDDIIKKTKIQRQFNNSSDRIITIKKKGKLLKPFGKKSNNIFSILAFTLGLGSIALILIYLFVSFYLIILFLLVHLLFIILILIIVSNCKTINNPYKFNKLSTSFTKLAITFYFLVLLFLGIIGVLQLLLLTSSFGILTNFLIVSFLFLLTLFLIFSINRIKESYLKKLKK